jgi:hypothetical protein
MLAAFVVALITAFGSVLTTVWSVRRQHALARQQHDWEATARSEERLLAAKEQLDKYREPLLTAAEDVLHRVRNIRERNFLVYLQSTQEQRRQLALLGTLYLLGKYWATVEHVYRAVALRRFETETETKGVAGLLSEIASTFASDQIDGSRLMVWRDEQRAIAELLQPATADGLLSIGFASFVEDYPTRLEPWFSQLAHDLQAIGVEGSQRLARLQDLLEQLVQQLKAGRQG